MRLRLKVAAAAASEWVELEAESPEEAVRMASRSGYRVLAVVHPNVQTVGFSGIARRRAFPLLLFTQELMALLDAGLNVVEAIDTLRRKEVEPAAMVVLDGLLTQLREGKSLSDAFTRYPDIFPPVFVAGIVASERNGTLASSLGRYVAYHLQLETIRKKVISSSIYPLMLIVVGGLVTLFLLGYVVPKFSVVLESAGREAAFASRVLLRVGQFLFQNPWLVSGVAGVAAFLVIAMVIDPGRRQAFLLRLQVVPVIARIATSFALARFYRTVSLLLDSGIPLLRSLEMARALLPPTLAIQLDQACVKISAGHPLSDSLAGSSIVTPIAESLIRVGERSGKLAEMMERTARFLDEELSRRIETFSRLFEPLLMTAIGIVIGVVVVLMYMPIFDLVGSVG